MRTVFSFGIILHIFQFFGRRTIILCFLLVSSISIFFVMHGSRFLIFENFPLFQNFKVFKTFLFLFPHFLLPNRPFVFWNAVLRLTIDWSSSFIFIICIHIANDAMHTWHYIHVPFFYDNPCRQYAFFSVVFLYYKCNK